MRAYTHKHKHTDSRTKVISRNHACPWFKKFFIMKYLETYVYSLNCFIFHRKLDLASPDDVDGVDISSQNQDFKDVPIDDQDDIDKLYGLDHYDSDDEDDDDQGINFTITLLYSIDSIRGQSIGGWNGQFTGRACLLFQQSR